MQIALLILSFVVVVVLFSFTFLLLLFRFMQSAKLHSLYVVYDSVAESVSGPVICFPSDAVAIRSFTDAVLGSGSVLALHHKDYALFQNGVIDLNTGIISPLENGLRHVLGATTVIELANREQPSLPLTDSVNG